MSTSNTNKNNTLFESLVKNPFVQKIKLTRTDKLKIAFNAIWLLPIRVFFITILMILAFLIATITTIGLNDQDLKENPLKGWRKKCKYLLRFFGRAIAFCFGFHKIKKNGIRVQRNEATIFVAAPHSSFMDAFVFCILGFPSSVSRIENAKIPFFGRIIRLIQSIYVSRQGSSHNKHLVIEEIKKRAAAPDNDWSQLLLFPEGTTTNRSCLITFKPGAFIPGLPVQPIAIKYNNKLDTITWTWEGFKALEVVLYTLCQFSNYMEVTYLPV